MTIDVSSLLYEPILEGLRAAEFAARVTDDVCELEELFCTQTAYVHLENKGLCEVYVLHNGLVAVCSEKTRWSLFKTESRVNSESHLNAWHGFARGAWTRTVPSQEGLYFCKDNDLGRRSVRELVRVRGRLLDISGGMVPPGKVTTWAGWWYSEKIPPLPDSY